MSPFSSLLLLYFPFGQSHGTTIIGTSTITWKFSSCPPLAPSSLMVNHVFTASPISSSLCIKSLIFVSSYFYHNIHGLAGFCPKSSHNCLVGLSGGMLGVWLNQDRRKREMEVIAWPILKVASLRWKAGPLVSWISLL